MGQAEFDFVMIKPSHYDDDGYPIVWWRTLIPSNSLAALNGIAVDCVERQVLGPDVRINLHTIDETNTHIVPRRIVADLKRRNARAVIGLVGVQSNQYNHALDLAREFRAAGVPVMIGGFHISGCISMLKELPAEIQEALDMGCSLFAGTTCWLHSSIGTRLKSTSGPSTCRCAASRASPFSAASELDGRIVRHHTIG